MGASALPDICAALTKAGMSPDTPAAAVERGTTARQRRIEGTLGTLTEIAKARGAALARDNNRRRGRGSRKRI